jgi:hypothetical protein
LSSAVIERGVALIELDTGVNQFRLDVSAYVSENSQYSVSGSNIALYSNETNRLTTADLTDEMIVWISRPSHQLAAYPFRLMLTTDMGVVILTSSNLNSTSCSLWLLDWGFFVLNISDQLNIDTIIPCSPMLLVDHPQLAAAYQNVVTVAINTPDDNLSLFLYHLPTRKHYNTTLTGMEATTLTVLPGGIGVQGRIRGVLFALALLPFAPSATDEPWNNSSLVLVPLLHPDEKTGSIGYCSDDLHAVTLEVGLTSNFETGGSAARVLRGLTWEGGAMGLQYRDFILEEGEVFSLGCNATTILVDTAAYHLGQISMRTSHYAYNESQPDAKWLAYLPSKELPSVLPSSTTAGSTRSSTTSTASRSKSMLGLALGGVGSVCVALAWTCYRWRVQRAATKRVISSFAQDVSTHDV